MICKKKCRRVNVHNVRSRKKVNKSSSLLLVVHSWTLATLDNVAATMWVCLKCGWIWDKRSNVQSDVVFSGPQLQSKCQWCLTVEAQAWAKPGGHMRPVGFIKCSLFHSISVHLLHLEVQSTGHMTTKITIRSHARFECRTWWASHMTTADVKNCNIPLESWPPRSVKSCREGVLKKIKCKIIENEEAEIGSNRNWFEM